MPKSFLGRYMHIMIIKMTKFKMIRIVQSGLKNWKFVHSERIFLKFLLFLCSSTLYPIFIHTIMQKLHHILDFKPLCDLHDLKRPSWNKEFWIKFHHRGKSINKWQLINGKSNTCLITILFFWNKLKLVF